MRLFPCPSSLIKYAICCFGCLLFFRPRLQAQDDLIQTLTEQLVKLELSLQEVKQGYDIVQKGLGVIGDIKKGRFDLHSLFFQSLETISPGLKKYTRIADIVSLQASVVAQAKKVLQTAVQSGQLTPGEVQYLTQQVTHLIQLTTQDIDELTGILTDGEWQMSDDQRLSQIDAVYAHLSDKRKYANALNQHILLTVGQRAQYQQSLQNLQKLY